MAQKLKSMDFAQRQLVMKIYYVDKSGLPPEFVPQPILKDRFKKMKPISEISRAFSDHNKRYFNLHMDQICLFYTPNSSYAINEICYLPIEELIEVKDKPHYMLEPQGKDYPISCSFTLYFRDRYIILVAQNETVYNNWLNHFEIIRSWTTRKSILTRLRTPYIQTPGLPPQMYPPQEFYTSEPGQQQDQVPAQQAQQQQQIPINEKPTPPPSQDSSVKEQRVEQEQKQMTQSVEQTPPKPEQKQRPKSGRRLQDSGVKLRQSSESKSQVQQPNASLPPRQQEENSSAVNQFRNTYNELPSNGQDNFTKQKTMINSSILQSSKELHNRIDNQGIKDQSQIIKNGPIRPIQAINSNKQDKPYETPIKVIGDALAQTNSQVNLNSSRGRVMETPKQYIQPVRLDSNGRSYRKTTSQSKMEAPVERPSTGRRTSARNIWQDFDDEGNVIVKPKILQANFTGSLKMAKEVVVSPPKVQKSFTKEEEDFDESEFMKNILGIKQQEKQEKQEKQDQSSKNNFFLEQPEAKPIETRIEPKGGFFLQGLQVAQNEPVEEDEVIDFSICQTPQKQPEPIKKLTYDDWDDE